MDKILLLLSVIGCAGDYQNSLSDTEEGGFSIELIQAGIDQAINREQKIERLLSDNQDPDIQERHQESLNKIVYLGQLKSHINEIVLEEYYYFIDGNIDRQRHHEEIVKTLLRPKSDDVAAISSCKDSIERSAGAEDSLVEELRAFRATKRLEQHISFLEDFVRVKESSAAESAAKAK